MERKSELTKALLGEKFKELVAKKGFEKLTIKMITDAAGAVSYTHLDVYKRQSYGESGTEPLCGRL